MFCNISPILLLLRFEDGGDAAEEYVAVCVCVCSKTDRELETEFHYTSDMINKTGYKELVLNTN